MDKKLNNQTLLKCIHFYLMKEADRDGIINRRKIPAVLGRGFHIPKVFHRKVLSELEDAGIIIENQKMFVKIKVIPISI